ncbi:MAG: transposase [Patescibacteria group bacterium]
MPRFNEDSYAHCVTTKTYKSQKIFTDERCCRIVMDDIGYYRQKLSFKVIVYCLMPDHLHLIVQWDVAQYPKLTISTVMHRIKGRSAKRISDYFLRVAEAFMPRLVRGGA